MNEKSADRMWEDIKSALKSQACGTPHLTASTTKSSVSCDLEGATALPGLWGWNVGILLLSGLEVMVYVQNLWGLFWFHIFDDQLSQEGFRVSRGGNFRTIIGLGSCSRGCSWGGGGGHPVRENCKYPKCDDRAVKSTIFFCRFCYLHL